jgi:hypothetical protein
MTHAYRPLVLAILLSAACRPTPPPDTTAPAANDESALKEIQATIQSRLDSLRKCYVSALGRDNEAGGHISYNITISSGAVTNIAIVEDTTQDEQLKACTIRKIGRWQFPIVQENLDVAFKVVFSGAP